MIDRPSWHPDYYGEVHLSPSTLETLRAAADVMIPGSDHYPSASRASVVEFIREHINPSEQATLEALFETRDAPDSSALAARLRDVEACHPTAFATLRFLVYTAYYRAPEVIQAINARGFDYHGAPQPYGYEVAADIPLPQHTRGSFVPTNDVKRVVIG